LSQSDDISWPLVERIARDSLDRDDPLAEMSLLGGGVVATTLKMKTRSGKRAVLKISSHRVNHHHEREARQLQMLAELGIPAPRVLASQTGSLEWPHSFVLLEHVEGVTLKAARQLCSQEQMDALQTQLAEIALKLHAVTGEMYGKLEGASFTDWPTFFHSLVDPILQEAEQGKILPHKTTKTLRRLHSSLPALLSHGDVPRLCHGDFWSGNVMCRADESGDWSVAAILDPELRFSHAEAEIAYMDLFGTINATFKRTYQEHQRLPDAYHRVRKPVYQVYGLLNQFQMRGPEFAAALVDSVDRVSVLL
jgi:fructosamine-3-kinase